MVIGLYYDGLLAHNWRIETKPDIDINWHKKEVVTRLFEANVDSREISLVVLSSVVPRLTQPFRSFLESLFINAKTVIIGPDVYPMIELEVVRPREIGTDLVANAYAAIKRYGTDCIVVDFGTALTVLAAGADWRIHGVSIAPGIGTAVRSLHSSTAQLPEVPLEMPKSALGRNTEHAIQSGVLIGYTGLVEKLIERYKTEWQSDAKIIATGGLMRVLHPLRNLFHETHPNLTLDGMRLIGQRVLLSD